MLSRVGLPFELLLSRTVWQPPLPCRGAELSEATVEGHRLGGVLLFQQWHSLLQIATRNRIGADPGGRHRHSHV
jgi:hypothetical protein